ncbi:MAG: dockerin type I repeat-containing protein [Candidatus Marinimicrobia bacterium]|nr:dockerin type I repeat-containing protein [Candidatus Neomarinimicrobiota bacterium]
MGQAAEPPEVTMKEFQPAGRIEALVEDISENKKLVLVQLDLKNDSLLQLASTAVPSMELYSGPASYHRIMSPLHLTLLQNVITTEFIKILNADYHLPTASREVWVDFKQGSETMGTWSDDDAIEYTCACLSGASDCVKLGWDDSWWNPLDYWGEAWYGYSPPFHQSVEEVRITVRGGQCDDLPLWSETYMGMMDSNGNWSHDYELSINYTDNEYIVNQTWSNDMLIPRIGSEDNYCIDHIRLQFFYSCEEPENPTNLLASDEENCYTVNLNWSLSSNSDVTEQILYRDDIVIAQLSPGDNSYEDWGAQSGMEHIYCIEAVNECGTSQMTCNPGSVKSAPESPVNVTASDGEFYDGVVISWSSTPSAEEFKIYRDDVWMGLVSSDFTQYTDVIAESEVVYDYCVESVNTCGSSDWKCDSGFSSLPPGDVNADGMVDVLDLVVVVNIIIQTHIPTDDEFNAADLNGDGMVDVLDIVQLVNQILEN